MMNYFKLKICFKDMMKENVPQILINRESLKHMCFDIELLGDCDVIVKELLMRLGDTWSDLNDLTEKTQLALVDNETVIESIIQECETYTNNLENEVCQASTSESAIVTDIVEALNVNNEIKTSSNAERYHQSIEKTFISHYLKGEY